MKQLNSQQIKHIDEVLIKLEQIIDDSNKPENRVDYEMLVSELLCSNKNWSERLLFGCLHGMKYMKKGFNYEHLSRLCESSIENYRLMRTIKYYVPVNYNLQEKNQLNSVTIKKVSNSRKCESILKGIERYKINSQHYEFNFDLLQDDSYSFLEFSVAGIDYNSCYDKFYATFLLLRGILEFSYFRNIYNFKFGRHYPRNTSMIIHPPFVYIESKEYKRDLHFFKNRQTKAIVRKFTVNEGNELVSRLLDLLKDENQNDTTRYLLSNCLRLYSLAIDSTTWEHAFLYLWNILDEITLSQKNRGNTQTVLERCIRFTDDDFINLYRNKINSLVSVRNNLVHKGISNVSDSDVGLLKLICVNAILFLVEEMENIVYVEQLELVYELKNVSIDSLTRRREIIDTIITKRTANKKVRK